MTGAVRSNPAEAAAATNLALLDRVLFYVLLVVLCARPLISETFQYLQVSFLTALQAERGPTPATTAGLDSLLLATAALALARRGRWRRSPFVAAGIGLLAVAVGLSTAVAGDKPVALLAGSSMLISVLAGAALVSLVRTRWMLALLLAALLATGAITAVKCISQRWYENPLTQQTWESMYKPKLLRRGFDPEDPLFINFERRMQAGEAYGFLGHPNVTASCLMMWFTVALGVVAALVGARLRRGPPVAASGRWTTLAVSLLLCALPAVALPLTGSRGALVGGAVAVLALAVLGVAARWRARHAAAVLSLLVAGYVSVIAAGVGYGLKNGTLPGASLAFRWDYWTAAWRAWQDVPLTGLGRENFGTAYMQYKRPQSPEEVQNPHSLWVSLLVELGPLGLAAGVFLCGACVLAGLRGLTAATGGSPLHAPLTAIRATPVAVGVLLVQALFSGTPFNEPGMLLVWGQEIALVWVLALLCAMWVLSSVDVDARRVVWLGAGLCAALVGTLVHSLIDFVLLTPAGLGLFVLCAVGASAVGRLTPTALAFARLRGAWAAVPVAAGIVLAGFHVVWITRPAVATTRALGELEVALYAPPPRGGPEVVRAVAAQIMGSRTTSALVARSAGRALFQASRSPQLGAGERVTYLTEARTCAGNACARNPDDASNYALAATIDEELGQAYEKAGDIEEPAQERQRAAEDWQRAVEHYPTSARNRLSAGKAWLAVWRQTGARDAADLAGAHFRAALEIDDSRPPEEVMRLRAAERRVATEGLASLGARGRP